MIDTKRFPLGSLEFLAECRRIVALREVAADPKPGTLGHLITRYRASSAFNGLAVRTKADYQRCFDHLQPIAGTLLDRFSSPFIVKIMDKTEAKHGRHLANYVKTVLALTFAWGKERGYIKSNPAEGIRKIRRPRGIPDANRPWSDSERHAVEAALPAHMRLPVALMMYCGLDPSDALKLPPTAVSKGMFDARRGKTGVAMWFPLPDPVIAALAVAPKHDAITLCANSYGKPWTLTGFNSSWRTIKLRLERSGAVLPGLTMKGLRHTVATILAEIGHDERTIADLLGQATIEMARLYSKRANKTKKMTKVVTSLNVEVNDRRTKIVKLP